MISASPSAPIWSASHELPRTYDTDGIRRIESPPRTFLRITEHKDITLPGIGPQVEEQLREIARERVG